MAKLLRAEWMNVEVPCNWNEAPQPHWHLDKELLPEEFSVATIAQGQPPAGQAAADSSEQAAPVMAPLCLSKMHLGMGGWTHSEDTGRCWQKPMTDTKALVCWASRTLEQILSELPHLPRTDALAGV